MAQLPPSQYPTPDPLAAPPTPVTPATKMRDRAQSWKNLFIAVLVIGLLGAAFLGVAASQTTTSYGIYGTTTSTDSGAGLTVFAIAAVSTILFALPFLAFSQIINGQADLYES